MRIYHHDQPPHADQVVRDPILLLIHHHDLPPHVDKVVIDLVLETYPDARPEPKLAFALAHVHGTAMVYMVVASLASEKVIHAMCI